MRPHFVVVSVLLLLFYLLPQDVAAQRFYSLLYDHSQQLIHESSHIPGDRRDTLKSIGDTLLQMIHKRGSGEILFTGVTDGTLTQLAQTWLYTALSYYKVKGIKVFSGGLRPDAINYRIVAALKRSGFPIMPVRGYSDNPVYVFNLGRNLPDYTIFAKSIDYHLNPHAGYLVVPVTRRADSIDYDQFGAAIVIPYHWSRPDLWDDTRVEAMKYDQCTHEIGRDMFFLAAYLDGKMKARKKEDKSARKRKKKKKG